ncbi:MAG: DNA internalization-related competence protein ComEC/Rec2 [candidate division Zixibacteria bacterium]|nr:DNA internalization-related competence protein ComEC/Rec2 [candidate division Zixibacteria bacterium]
MFHTSVILPLRNNIEHTIDATLDGTAAPLLKGLLLGRKHQLPEDLTDAFSITGLTHILSVSGLHVGLLIFILWTLFSALRLPRAAVAGATFGVIVVYAFLTQLAPSVVRASIMGGLFLTGRLLDRQTDGLNMLGVAGLIILMLWPQAVFDLGCQLSFVATASIISVYPRLKELLPTRIGHSSVRWVSGIRDALLVSAAAQLGTAPIIASAFYQISIISPLANLFAGPLVFAATALGVLGVATGPISLAVADLFGASNGFILAGMVWVARFFAEIPFASLSVPAPSLFLGVLFYTVGIAVLWPPRDRKIRYGMGTAGLLVAVGGWVFWAQPAELRITVLDVGQGDAIFIATPNGRTMLIDGGLRTPDYDAGARVVLPFLRAHGYRRIDAVFLSHPHADHYGGMTALFDEIEVGEVITGGMTGDTPLFRAWETAFLHRKIRYRAALAGDRIGHGGEVDILVLHPSFEFMDTHGVEHANDASLTLRLTYGGFSMLFAGDVEEKGERALTAGYPALPTSIVKVPHHGSSTSSGISFIERFCPKAAVISVGAYNAFRHPARAVIERYGKAGAQVYRTDRSGAVTIRSDGKTFTIDEMLSGSSHSDWISPRRAFERICLTEIFRSPILRCAGLS